MQTSLIGLEACSGAPFLGRALRDQGHDVRLIAPLVKSNKNDFVDAEAIAEAYLTPQMRNLIDMLWGEWKTVEQQIEELTDKLEQISA
ncbi:MAG: transposase family protein, partial [Edaphobacter sp.]|nr:transposase family protein [Edaphobacter sp.]